MIVCFFFSLFGFNSAGVIWAGMSHDHFFPCKYFSSHIDRFRLVFDVNVFLIKVELVITRSRFSLKSFLTWLHFFQSGAVFFYEVHVLRGLE
jgi:hypothetical protein